MVEAKDYSSLMLNMSALVLERLPSERFTDQEYGGSLPEIKMSSSTEEMDLI